MGLDNAIVYIDNIAAAFAQHDPDNAATYEANAAAYKDELRATLEPLRETVAEIPEDQRWLVTCEGAFSYLARDFGLRELYLWPMNADQNGTPQQVRKVIDGVRDNDIPVVFCESTVNTSPAEQVARETGAAYGGVLYVDSLSSRTARCRPTSTFCASPPKRSSKALHPTGLRRVFMQADKAAGVMNVEAQTAGITARDVTVTYRNGHTALRHASFAIPRGTVTALVGVNGAGKSTLSRRSWGSCRSRAARSSFWACQSARP